MSLALSRVSIALIASLIRSTFTLSTSTSALRDFNGILKLHVVLILGALSDLVRI